MTDTNGAEIRQFIERWERLEAERKDLAQMQKDVMSEARGRGYDSSVLREIIRLRAMSPDDVAEREALLETYKSALRM